MRIILCERGCVTIPATPESVAYTRGAIDVHDYFQLISLLTFFIKIYEKLLKYQLKNYVNLFHQSQFGFHKNWFNFRCNHLFNESFDACGYTATVFCI